MCTPMSAIAGSQWVWVRRGVTACMAVLFVALSLSCDRPSPSAPLEPWTPLPAPTSSSSESMESVRERGAGQKSPNPIDTGGRTAVETTRPFDPITDCSPTAGPSPSRSERNQDADPEASPETGESTWVVPPEGIVLVNHYQHYPEEVAGRSHIASGVVLPGTTYVATALDFSQPLGCLEVVPPGGTALPARLVALHRLSGAAILEVNGGGLPEGVHIPPDAVLSETAVRIYHGTGDGSYSGIDGAATTAGGEALWVVATGLEPAVGDAVFDTAGGFVGVIVPRYQWRGLHDGTPGGAPKHIGYTGLSTHVAMGAPALMQLAQVAPDEELLNTPVKVRFLGAYSVVSPIDGDPIAIGEKFAGYLKGLDAPIEVEGLGGPFWSILRGMGAPQGGTNLEVLYPVPQSLEASDGSVLGYARYFVMFWGRGVGIPDLILAGSDNKRITHVFEVHGLEELWSHTQATRLTQYTPFLTNDSAGFPSEYPLRWSLISDEPTYSPGETVQISLRVENVSILPVDIELPIPFRVDHARVPHSWEMEFTSVRYSETVNPGEVLVLTVDWDQTDAQGMRVPAGSYQIYRDSNHAASGAYARSASFEILE